MEIVSISNYNRQQQHSKTKWNLKSSRRSSLGYLKVPKREIVDHSDFHDFYAIKSLTVSDFEVKIKIV